MTWVGRAIRRLEDPALITGPRPLHRRSARRALGALRAQPGRGRKDREDRRAERRDGDHRRRSQRREEDHCRCCTSSTTSRSASRSWPTASCALSASRSPRWSRRARKKPRTSPIWSSCRSTKPLPVIDARAALAPGAPQVHAEAPGNVILEGKFKTPDFDAVWNGAHKIVKSKRARAGRTRRRWRRAAATQPMTLPPAA